MSKKMLNRIENVEKILGPEESLNQGKDDLREWIELLEKWPVHLTPKRISEEEKNKLQITCRGIADRVRAGELTNQQTVMGKLPADAIIGLLAYFDKIDCKKISLRI